MVFVNQYAQDNAGNLVQSVRDGAPDVPAYKEAGGETLTTTYYYDPNGNMISKMPKL